MSRIDECIEKLESIFEDVKDYKWAENESKEAKLLENLYDNIGQLLILAKMTKIKEVSHPEGSPIKITRHTGRFVSVRPCAKKYEDKTYLGIYIGDGALSSSVSIEDDSIACCWSFYNPAILVPELNEIIYGCESWWGIIEREEDLKSITDLDIENVWYVKALKELNKGGE